MIVLLVLLVIQLYLSVACTVLVQVNKDIACRHQTPPCNIIIYQDDRFITGVKQFPLSLYLDDVPTLGYLQLLKWYDSQNKRQDLRLLRDLAPIWDKTAETLHLSVAEIRIIEKNNTGDQSGRIREVVVKWLSNGSMLPEAGRYPVNWRGFYHLLLDAEQSDMAIALKSALSANRSNIRKTF